MPDPKDVAPEPRPTRKLAHEALSKPVRKPGALVEDETQVGMGDGSVRPKQPDGKVDEGATDPRESRKK